MKKFDKEYKEFNETYIPDVDEDEGDIDDEDVYGDLKPISLTRPKDNIINARLITPDLNDYIELY
jgi:hypothetical protein